MTLPLADVTWIHGVADCTHSTDPLIQVHQYDADTFVLRVSKCFSYEGNFIYLLFGDNKAIMLDTGGPPNPVTPFNHGKTLPVRQTVDAIVAQRKLGGGGDVDLIVAHTHSHNDHAAWDGEFSGRPRTAVVPTALAGVKSFFGLPNWSDGEATLDLGNRRLTVFPIPGHEAAHIAVYDPRNKWLLTGDTLYPGLLTIADWNAYRASAARLAQFADQHEISAVLGAHVEMKNVPQQLYPIGTTFQPQEHVLPLTAAHIQELHKACVAMAGNPHQDVHDDFIIDDPQ
ncbi:MBL fold metallo-hydrolase [Bradyrhizobium sp. 193]|uniref:MBL fold metallo-hydrolase n=1 Tax=Bradyrhizobium sp. 193 TaxID=2782661 RepID=UPI001FF918F7|nr:MBL fold metallo-hydrolase [Bradyrhizobium sp. 193]MCK1481213.1 MBL fold metallo-hydrolase [Bradyrhizobium sp. 193]